MGLSKLAQVTLRDVSHEARVSLATADRVLNGRPGVRDDTVQRVREACERLGYRANPFASRLARGGIFRLMFVLPRGANPFMRDLARQVERTAAFLKAQHVAVELVEVDAFDPALQCQALQRLAGIADGVAVVALDHPLVTGAIDRLAAAGTAVVTLVSDAPGSARAHYVGIDNLAAGRTAGTLLGRFTAGRPGTVGIVLGSPQLRDHIDRAQGFNAILAQRYPGLRPLPARVGQDDDNVSAAVAAELLANYPDLVGLYAAGAGTGGIAGALAASGRERDVVLIGHELGEAACSWLRKGTIDALINQDAGHETRSAVRLLMAQLTGEPTLPEQERIRIEVFVADNLP